MAKSISKSSPSWAHGGPGGSIKPENGANPQSPGVSSQEGSVGGAKFASGGKTHMFGQGGANPAVPGDPSPDVRGKGAQFASGGKTCMCGFTGSRPVRPGNSAAS